MSKNSPLLIIKNEKQERRREINERQLRGEFTHLKESLPTNFATNRGLPEILTTIQHYIQSLPHVGTELPKTWVKVREALEGDNRNYISLDDYLRICQDNGFTHQEDALQLSGYLHDLGVCLHFQKDDLLMRTVSSNSLGAPILLSPNQPEYDWDESENLFLRYEYEFMPKGILTRFIVEIHPLIEQQTCVWKTGVILSKEGARAEVIELYRYHKGEIRIRVTGNRKRDLLTTVRHELDKIHDSYERLKYKTLVPCNCSTCKHNETPHFYDLKRLYTFLDTQKPRIQCYESGDDVEVRGLIDDINISSMQPPTESSGNPTTINNYGPTYGVAANVGGDQDINLPQRREPHP